MFLEPLRLTATRPLRPVFSSIVLFIKGVAMGVADIIPGVSGGTIAFVTGIYERLIGAISGVKLLQLKHFVLLMLFFWHTERRKKSVAVLADIDWGFLVVLFVGIVTGVLSMARVIAFLLAHYPFYMYSFFFGLILFSFPVLVRKIDVNRRSLALLVIFAASTYLLIGPDVSTAEGDKRPLYVFLSGVIAISAMILPGVSGSYILVMLGQYATILNALNERDLLVIGSFMAGAAVGLFTFVRILKVFLKYFYSLTLAALSGILIGSLRKIWPGNFIEPEMMGFSTIALSLGLIVLGGLLIHGLNKISRITR